MYNFISIYLVIGILYDGFIGMLSRRYKLQPFTYPIYAYMLHLLFWPLVVASFMWSLFRGK